MSEGPQDTGKAPSAAGVALDATAAGADQAALARTEATPGPAALARTEAAPGLARQAALDETVAVGAPGRGLTAEDTITAPMSRPRAGVDPDAGAVAFDRGDIIGRYVVLTRLGAGAMGVVFAAYDPELDRKVAIKLLKPHGPDLLDGSAGMHRLLREAQALARLNHTNVVGVHDVGVHLGQVFVAMEFVEGMTLSAWLAAQRRSWREVVRVFTAAGRGLEAAHAAGIVHRDFKPDNVMVGDDGRVRVMDFGLARAEAEAAEARRSHDAAAKPGDLARSRALAAELTQAGALMGTPLYMSPEQFHGEPATPLCDQFAFCVALYEALYGQQPFAGETVPELTLAVTSGALRPAPRGARAPSWLHKAIVRGLSTRPSARHPGMTALLRELETGDARRRRMWFGLGVAALVGVAAGGIGHQRIDHARRVEACELAGQVLAAEWDESARTRVSDGLLESGTSFAADTAERVLPWLERYVREWSEHRTAACTRRTVDGTWDDATFDKSLWCLEERRLAFLSLIEELGRADAIMAEKAVRAATELGSSASCVDPVVLAGRPTPPEPALRPQAAEVLAALAQADALGSAGKFADGLAIAGQARERAQALDWAPLVAAARFSEAQLANWLGDYAAAEAAAIDVFTSAGRARDWNVAASAAQLLITNVGSYQARPREGGVWAALTELAIHHAGDPLQIREAVRLNALGIVADEAGDHAAACRLYEQALAIFERAHGPESLLVARVVNNLGIAHKLMGDVAAARAMYGRALAIRERVLGPDHPEVASVLNNLGNLLDLIGDAEAARTAYERALMIRLRALGPEHPQVASLRVNLGTLHAARGELPEAEFLCADARASLERTLGPEHPDVAQALDCLGDVRLALADPATARDLHARALTLREAAFGAEHFDNVESLRGLGRASAALGEPAAALSAFERAVALMAGDSDRATSAAATLELARALWDAPASAGGDRGRARALVEQARAGLPPREELRATAARLDAWLGEHPREQVPGPASERRSGTLRPR